MTHLRKRMLEELQRRNYSEGTTRAYLQAVEHFARHFGKSPDKLGPDDLRSYRSRSNGWNIHMKCSIGDLGPEALKPSSRRAH